ncbi:50S ribosomal protein L21e [Candidatus Korarchaeum cryptofilum]|jgi:large subunit ribosomal protein L21e|uniref:Large ribosomal subunit protein eL21 n=2 Tax=Candidatus Korarchaeum cryptofilum TaxID=498846 RepID=RL21_KORCO|nr:50S ribosomal protein L21e [Candidatus Korarchaeum cryptofilum]B1L7A8.1 RecName: Full=Large ribosomal subunit protein eL21; AltName: Full=50S ribosomal protein L21e [Candidatus Korarchaeum cryptofilum OPF8]ACB08337.1 Ribosomal protein L21e [Candidatus Korarchaeum cryptofilum OPF8]RSN69102.1 50S ribosomal protein L21e [Candidatus Korarchaeum cryptofilum]
MGRRSFGFLYRSRDFLSKTPRERGRPSPAKLLKEFEVGDKVVIDVEPSIRRGMPHRRYQGKVGVVMGRRGEAYLVDIKLGGKTKHLIVLPVHLKKHSG